MFKLVFRWVTAMAIGWLLLAAFPALSQSYDSAADQFAARITERAATPAPVSISFRNISSLSNQAVSDIRAELLRQLETQGWKLKKSEDAELAINVTLAENLQDYVWTAEIVSGSSREYALYEIARPKTAALLSGSRTALSRTLLASSDAPLLDATLLEGKVVEGAHLLALEAGAVDLYLLQSGHWQLVQRQPLGREPVGARDLRGRIVPDSGNNFDVFLPGIHCNGVAATALSISCRDSDDPWPLSDDQRTLAFYAGSRNFFTGVLSGAGAQAGSTTDPFYSMAILNAASVYIGVDGGIHLLENNRRPVLIGEKWGSELAAVQGACGSSEFLLATRPVDFTQPDAITAFQLSGADVVPATDALAFAGPVLSLKTSSDHQQAFAIVGTNTGRYEAYLITPRCGA
jgi:hypothetical protein